MSRVTPDPSTEPIATDEDYDEWLRLFANRNEVAEEYATAMRRNGLEWNGYARINQAILRRWSMAGLKYIKERAWKIATQNLMTRSPDPSTEALRELLAKATPEKWSYGWDGIGGNYFIPEIYRDPKAECCSPHGTSMAREADAALIVAAVNALPELLNKNAALAARLRLAEEHLSHIRPLRETEWQVIYRQDDVLHAARCLSRSIGEINTTADLDLALKRYDEAVTADHAAALAASSAGETPDA